MKNEEVKEIFDEVDGDLQIIKTRLFLLSVWLHDSAKPSDLCAREWGVENKDFQTPAEYLAFIIERLEGTREFFKEWRERENLG